MVSNTSLQAAPEARNFSFLTAAAAIGASVLANNNMASMTGERSSLADNLSLISRANAAIDQAEGEKIRLDVSQQDAVDDIINEIRDAIRNNNYTRLSNLTQTLNERVFTAQANQQTNNRELNDVQIRERLQAIQNEIDERYTRQRAILEEAYRDGLITERQYRDGIAAVGEAQEANQTFGPGSEETRRANAAAADVINPIADSMDRQRPGSGEEVRNNQRSIGIRDTDAQGLRAELTSLDQTSPNNTITASAGRAEPMRATTIFGRPNSSVTAPAQEAMVAAAPNANANPLENGQEQVARLQYAEASEAESAPSQQTPSAPVVPGAGVARF